MGISPIPTQIPSLILKSVLQSLFQHCEKLISYCFFPIISIHPIFDKFPYVSQYTPLRAYMNFYLCFNSISITIHIEYDY